MSSAATHLRVRVMEAGRPKVDLTMPARAAAHLADLVPADLGEKVRELGIDVAAIAATAAADGFPPGELFRLQDGGKDVRVWLE